MQRWREARRDPAFALLEGLHPLKHALRFGASIEAAWTSEPGRIKALAAKLAPDVAEGIGALLRPVSTAALAGIASAPLRSPVVALARRPAPGPDPLAGEGRAPFVFLEAPTHLGNVGAAVRAAAAAGAGGLLTTGPHDPWHPAALRGSAGLHFALPVRRVAGPADTARPLVAFDPGGEPLRFGAIPDGAVLLFGTERGGLSPLLKARAGRRLALPMRPGVSSLNLATAVAVALYAWRLGRP